MERGQRITAGKVLGSVETGGFVFTESRHPAGMRLAPHEHERATLCLVTAGAFRETMNGDDTDCRPGSLVLKRAGQIHGNDFGPTGARSLMIEVLPQRLAALREVAAAALDHTAVLPQAGHGEAFRRLTNAFAYTADPLRPLVLEGLALELIADVERSRSGTAGKEKGAPAWLLRARAMIDDLALVGVRLDDVASEVGIHPVHLARSFKRLTGSSVGDYVRHRRLAHARTLLARTDWPISHVADRSGFCDQAHLTRVFRLQLGITPAAYRRMMSE